MENLNEGLAKSLLESIKGEGEDVIFSPEEVEKDRRRQYDIMIGSIRKERRRSVIAREAASRIYLD
jgi:hypothetical protein